MKAVYIKAKPDMKRDLQYIGIDELYGIDLSETIFLFV